MSTNVLLKEIFVVTVNGSIYEIYEDRKVNLKKIQGANSGLYPGNILINNFAQIIPEKGIFILENYDPENPDPCNKINWNYKSSAICAIVESLEKAQEIAKNKNKTVIDQRWQKETQETIDIIKKHFTKIII